MSKISIILPTRNNENHIDDLLNSIFSQMIEGDIEVVMLDSSDDLTLKIALRYSEEHNLKIIRVEPEDYNYGGTRNLGASLSSGDYLVFISTDVKINDDYWLMKLSKNLEDPLVAGVFGRQIPKEGASPMEEFFIKYTYSNIKKVYHLEKDDILIDFFFSNTNSIVRREIWEKFPFPEMLMSEDQEWAKRVLLAGYKIVYDPEGYVYHSHNYGLTQVFRRYFDSGATLPNVYNDNRLKIPKFLLRGFTYEINQIEYFLKNGYIKDIPYSILYDLFKFFGYFFGSKYKYIPKWLRLRLSYNPNYWYKYDEIIAYKK